MSIILKDNNFQRVRFSSPRLQPARTSNNNEEKHFFKLPNMENFATYKT